MRLLVAGGAGFIGSNFVEYALQRGHEITVLDALTYAGHRESLQDLPCDLIIGSICDGSHVLRLLKERSIDGLVNFAAESHVDRSISDPAAFIQTNIEGTFRLLNASLEHYKTLTSERQEKYRHLQVSTDEVYGSLGPTGKFNETTPMAPNSPYSASKAAGDHLVRAWHHTYNLPTLTTNCSNNYGPKQFPEKLIPYMIHCAISGKPLPVYGDGGNIRDWIHVEDHCNGILLALEKGKVGGTYCFGGDSERDNMYVVKAICSILDELRPREDGKKHEAGVHFVKDRLGHDRRYAIDDTLAQKELGFKRRYQFESGLRQTVQWYLDNDAWCKSVLGGKK